MDKKRVLDDIKTMTLYLENMAKHYLEDETVLDIEVTSEVLFDKTEPFVTKILVIKVKRKQLPLDKF